MEISRSHARRFLLVYQGLLPPRQWMGKPGVLDYIRRVGCIQYDPLNIVGQNPDLVLQSRVRDYRPEMLRELLYTDRRLLDGWDKVMSIYPVEDWPYFERWRAALRSHNGRNAEAIRGVLDEVRTAIATRGPLSSLDIQINQIVEGSWSRPERLARSALETLYDWGELVVHHKVHTRKVYDFAHRCLPPELIQAPDPNLTVEQYHDWRVLRRIGSVGLVWNRAGELWLGMGRMQAPERKAALARLMDQGQVLQVQVNGLKEPAYLRTQDWPVLEAAASPDLAPPQAAILAPLDNLLWDRRMLRALFDFDYTWEVYVPAEKRRYGYYVLPVLYGDRFIARFDPALDRQRGVLAIKQWWWEAGVTPDAPMKASLEQCLQRFLEYTGAEHLEADEPKL